MSRGLKIVFIILVVIGIGLLSLCVWGYRIVTRSLPQTTGEIVLPGLQAEVRVYRDDYHIPHILAQNEHDLFFTQGFITAQDRLLQMDLWGRAAAGRLSEIVGSATLKMDSLMLTVGIRRTARRILPHLSPETRSVLRAYTDGINAYIQSNAERLPVEFTLLNYTPSPWEVVDCISILRWFGWQLNTGWTTDITMGAIVERVGIEKAKAIFPPFQEEKPRTIPWQGRPFTTLFKEIQPLWKDNFFPKTGLGSNSWAVSEDRSATGKPLLANDPHLSLDMPTIFYENHLVGGEFNVTGFSIPGLPGVIVGHNRKIAWGMTNLMADDLDLFVETLHPSDSMKYLHGGSYRTMEVIEEEIPVRGGPSIPMRIRKTHHGPVVSRFLPQHGSIRSVISLRWTGHEVSDEGLAFYRLNKAENWEAFREALRSYRVPSQNFVYADTGGNIGHQAAGWIPVRTKGAGYLPRNGDDPGNDWKGFIPYEGLPSLKNPPEGFIATANNWIVGKDHSYTISDLWAHSSRIRRIQQLLSEKETFSINDFKRMQADVLSVFAKEVIDRILPVLENISFDDPSETELIEKLSRWDGAMKTGSPEAALFEAFLRRLLANLFRDEMGDSLYAAYLELHSLPLRAFTHLLEEERSPWFDDVTTEDTAEDRGEIITKSFREAVIDLRQRLGENIPKWSWGTLHTLTFKHPLGQHPFLRRAFNLGPFRVGGSGTTINTTGYILKKPYDAVWGPAARLIVDLGNPDNSLSVISTGQSGQPLDTHYRDQIELYLGNRYHSTLSDTTKIVRSGWDLLKLKPGE